MMIKSLTAVVLAAASASAFAVGPGPLGTTDNTPISISSIVPGGIFQDVCPFTLVDPGMLPGSANPADRGWWPRWREAITCESRARLLANVVSVPIEELPVNIKALFAAVSVAAVAGAAQANDVVDTPAFSGLTATFEALHTAGSFTDTFTFTVTGSTTASVSVVTIGSGVADIDFTGSTLNGTPLTLTTDAGGFVELLYTPAAFPVTGPLTLIITGTSGANASYTGSLNVGAVPEAGTLALMLAGLGAVGWVARRRQQA